jgi:hypothetical protein
LIAQADHTLLRAAPLGIELGFTGGLDSNRDSNPAVMYRPTMNGLA